MTPRKQSAKRTNTSRYYFMFCVYVCGLYSSSYYSLYIVLYNYSRSSKLLMYKFRICTTLQQQNIRYSTGVISLKVKKQRNGCFFKFLSFLPRDALVHSAVLRLHVVRLSVCPSVCPSVCDVGGSGSHTLEILETNCTIN